MTLRSDLQRYGYFPRRANAHAENAGEALRDVNVALRRRICGYTQRVARYVATGNTATKIPLLATPTRPIMVLLGAAQLTADPGAPVAVTGTPNFYFANQSISVFEPAGLTANTAYDLTFLVIEEA